MRPKIRERLLMTMTATCKRRTPAAFLLMVFLCLSTSMAFTVTTLKTKIATHVRSQLFMSSHDENHVISRRILIQWVPLVAAGVIVSSQPVLAKEEREAPSLESLLYTILRVKEATQQEARLIKSGRFKDVQRANVKLAVKFMVYNYKLADTMIAASAFIQDTNKRLSAGDIGQAAVQNLLTILEYFDSSNVQNIKVGQDSMAGKEALVLKGLESARKNIDDFLTYFPQSTVEGARDRILKENELNKKEWDPSLGDIFNLPPDAV